MQMYFAVRTVLVNALTWLNPLFSIFAVVGYFDAGRLLPARRARLGLLATAVTMVSAQSGGLPPVTPLHWALFGALLVLNVCLATVFAHLGDKEAERTAERAATIAELERANARLEQAFAENAGLHAQLLVQAWEAGVADERRRLAAEIHDTIARGLTGIIAQLGRHRRPGPPPRARALERATALARHSLGEARRSVQNLSPAATGTTPSPTRSTRP